MLLEAQVTIDKDYSRIGHGVQVGNTSKIIYPIQPLLKSTIQPNSFCEHRGLIHDTYTFSVEY